jgi:parvulin-like peptidyl-prolyl isomerase
MKNHRVHHAARLAGPVLGLCLAMPACGQKAQPPSASAPADKVVLKVGGHQVTAGDLEFVIKSLPAQSQQALAAQGNRALGDRYAMMLVLSEKAESDHLDQSPDFQRQMAFERMQSLAQQEYQSLARRVKVTPQEVNQYFSAHAAEFQQVDIRQITVRKKAQGSNAPGLDVQQAHSRADEIRKALNSGVDAQKLAEQFKADPSVIIDPTPRSVKRQQMAPELAGKIFALKDGQVSDPIENNQALFLIQVVRHSQVDFKDASPEIEAKLQNDKMEAVLADLKAKAGVWMDPNYFGGPSMGAQPGAADAGRSAESTPRRSR